MINVSKPLIGSEEIDRVEEVLKTGKIAQGFVVAEFEKNFAFYCGSKFAVAVNSGTAALHVALYATGIKEGDEVVTTPFTFVATANSILMQRAKPVFADISVDDYNLDPVEVEKKITNKTKAILPVDLYGKIYNQRINNIAHEHNLKVIEDACQAHGAEFKNKKAGTFGDIGCFSFYATKNMTTSEGGMVVTDNEEYAEFAKRFRHHGQSEKTKYEYFDLGYNYRMTDIEASIGLEQLKKLNDFNGRRIRNAELLSRGLESVKGLILPHTDKEFKHVFHQYSARITPEFKMTRDEFVKYLTENGIGNAIFYPKPLHLHPHFLKMGYKKGDFPVAEKISGEIISLPVNPAISEEDLKFIIETIKSI